MWSMIGSRLVAPSASACGSAHAGEDVEAAPGKLAGGGGVDASRSTGHHEVLTTKRLRLS
jgi:hypothetical protein